MLNWWYRKEAPLKGLAALGGAFAGRSTEASIDATGGTKITSGSYTYHVFNADNSPSNFVVSAGEGDIELLVVAGGGAGGYDNGSGCGAGGVAHVPAMPVTAATYAVVTGGRIPGSTAYGQGPKDGQDSTFTHPTLGAITASGGAGGSMVIPEPGGYGIPSDSVSSPAPTRGTNGGQARDGGSGAGGRRTNPGNNSSYHGAASEGIQPQNNPSYPVTVNNYGNDGGTAPGGGRTWWFSGGGGGAGGAGNPATVSPGAMKGGPGQPFSNFPGPVLAPGIPTATSVANPSETNRTHFASIVGPTGVFAGGGAGCSESPVEYAAQTPGGGGYGSPGNPNNGVYGTGGGAGCGGSGSGSGAEGIVILRYES